VEITGTEEKEEKINLCYNYRNCHLKILLLIMIEREKVLTRRDFLKYAFMTLVVGCSSRNQPSSPELTPGESAKENLPESLPETEECLSLSFQNLSKNYQLVGIRDDSLEEALAETNLDPNYLLYFVFEDASEPETNKPTLKTILYVYDSPTNESAILGLELGQTLPLEGLDENERISFVATTAFRIHLHLIDFFQPYLEDGEVSREEEEILYQSFPEERISEIGEEILREIKEDESKLIFIFAPIGEMPV